MVDITPYIDSIKQAYQYASDMAGGEENIKTAAQGLWEWCKGKLTSKSEQKALAAFEEDPEGQADKLSSKIEDAIDDEKISLEELQAQSETFQKVINQYNSQGGVQINNQGKIGQQNVNVKKVDNKGANFNL